MTVHDYRQIGMESYFWSLPSENERYHRAASGRCTGPGGLALTFEGLVQRLGRRYYSLTDYFFCPTRHMLQSLRRKGAPAGKLVHLPNPVRIPATTGQGDRIVFAGRLAAEKSPDLMLDLAEAFPETGITIAGAGPERDYLSARAGTNVRLTGQLSADEMDDLYATAATVVITSCCRENSPGSMLEAMAAGICVVVPDQPALREWVEDGRTGRLYTTGNGGDLVRVVGEVIADRSTSARIGQRARDLVLARHDSQRIGECLNNFYRLAAQKGKMRRILL